jgi:superoxide dismutase, Fe-Mn family
MEYKLPPLPYAYDALEPYIDARTMEIHYTKHHQGYVNSLNKTLQNYPNLQTMSPDELLKDLSAMPKDIRTAVRNYAGGNANHTFFWRIMKKDGGDNPRGAIADIIKKIFGNFSALQDQFNTTAKTVFGSGWAWLCVDRKGDLVIVSSENQDSPLSQGLSPILGLDVWEHAYYLKYQNKRADYITAWWHVINWDQVEENYHAAVK